jgi:uncharacterized repeat protein (TIGR01451 family)
MKRYLALVSVAGGALWTAAFMFGSLGTQAARGPDAPLDVVINEIAWSGTLDDTSDEWIELYNNTNSEMDLTGWSLTAADGTPSILLTGSIAAHQYFLLERSADDTIVDIPADQIYTGALLDTGEELFLRDAGNNVVDSANADGGGWPAGTGGTGTPPRASMERIAPGQAGADVNWDSNDGVIRNGHGKNGTPLNGTPKARNSASLLPAANLRVDKKGPLSIAPGELITYTVALSNAGLLPAQATWLTDVLPSQVQFLAHTAPYPFGQPGQDTLVWDLGTVPTTTATTPITFTVTGRVDAAAYGELTNAITATSATTEASPADNHAYVTTRVGSGPAQPEVLVEAIYYDAYEPLDADEGFRVMNVSTVTADIGGWDVTDLEAAAAFPPGTILLPGQAIWCAREATAFARQFGFSPDFEFGANTDPSVPNMTGGIPRFANDDECILRSAGDDTIDAVVYEGGDTTIEGWAGPAVVPWTSGSTFAASGQILYRKRDQSTGLPMPDTDMAADWAQDPGDPVDGRRVLYPGWDLDAFFFTQRITETATLTVAVAPDNLYDAVAGLLAGAQESIQIESYSFHSRELADLLLERLSHGVSVTLLLEGAPVFEGVTDEGRWVARQLDLAGARVLFMVNDSESSAHDRYDNLHAKIIVVDGTMALVGSENLNNTSFAADDKSNGTAGRRGVYLITDAPGVVARLQALLDADADPVHHLDVVGCDQVPGLCLPPAGFEPGPTPDWITYTVRFPTPLTTWGTWAFEVIHSPENGLRDRDSLLGLVGRAGAGDALLIEAFYE